VVEIFFHLASKWSKWCAQTLHPFSQIFNFFGHSVIPIIAPPSENFQNCSIGWKVLFFCKKRCKYHLNRPTNVDAMSSGSKSTTHQSGQKIIKKVKNITFRPLTLTCVARFPPNLTGDRGGPCHHFRFITFLAPINSFAARGRRKFGWKCPRRSKLLIILSFIEIKQPNLAQLCRLRTRINHVNFVKIVQVTRPSGNYIGKIPIFSSFGAVNPHPWTNQGEIWHGGADLRPFGHTNLRSAPPCQISPWSVQRVAPVGRKSQKLAVSKNNTGRAACDRSCR